MNNAELQLKDGSVNRITIFFGLTDSSLFYHEKLTEFGTSHLLRMKSLWNCYLFKGGGEMVLSAYEY